MPYTITPQTTGIVADTTIYPTSGRWIPREQVGVSGSGHSVYPALRSYELRWDIISMAEFAVLQDFYDAVKATGSVVVGLPKYGDSPYVFQKYSGCALEEPQADIFFAEHPTSVVLIVTNIRV